MIQYPDKVDFVAQSWCAIEPLNPDICTAYTAYLAGKPVATSLLLLGAGSGIYGVSTIQARQRIGVRSPLPLLMPATLAIKLHPAVFGDGFGVHLTIP
jgi:hypothetical protein